MFITFSFSVFLFISFLCFPCFHLFAGAFPNYTVFPLMLSTVRLHIGRKLPDSLFFRIFGIILLYDKNKRKEIISMYHPDYIKNRKS